MRNFLITILFLCSTIAFGIEKQTPSGVIVKDEVGKSQSGYVGEILGTARTGTGGSGYNTRTNTVLTTASSSIISLTLNKGLYLVGGHIEAVKAANANNDRAYGYVIIGGTAVTGAFLSTNTNISGATMAFSFSTPVIITDDSAVVDVLGYTDANDSTIAANQMWAIRIADKP